MCGRERATRGCFCFDASILQRRTTRRLGRQRRAGVIFAGGEQLVNNMYEQMDFVLSGGALKLLTDFLAPKVPSALILVPRGADLHILDAVGTNPTQLILSGEALRLRSLFSSRPAVSPCELEQAQTEKEGWPWGLRMRGPHWEVYILLREKADESLLDELKPYAGLVRLWQQFQRVDANESKLSRLSYMILATKSTLASIFEPMPLEYFASFVADVLRESLFPKTVSILKDEGGRLSLLAGKMDVLPPREGIYAQTILPSAPVLNHGPAPYRVVLPIAEAETRLFCILEWEDLPDSEMLHFLELLGNLASRAIAINSLRSKNTLAASQASSGDFTILSLSSVLRALRDEEDRSRFLALAADVFLEMGQMSECLLSVWDGEREGYVLAEHRSGGVRDCSDHPVLRASRRCEVSRSLQPIYDLKRTPASEVLGTWGLDAASWKELERMQYLVPIHDGKSIVGFVALAADSGGVPGESQREALSIAAQFAGYEIRKFNS